MFFKAFTALAVATAALAQTFSIATPASIVQCREFPHDREEAESAGRSS
jgi:hypothetical protein